jgi:hypothetical protein
MSLSSNQPSFISHSGWNFLITDAPHDDNIDAYIKALKKHNISNFVRACDPSYSTEKLAKKKITVHVSTVIGFCFFFSILGVNHSNATCPIVVLCALVYRV